MRVVIAGGGTGGHLMPALALADALVEERSDLEPVMVGASRGVDAGILARRPYRYHLLPSEPIYRRQWWRNIRWPVLVPRLLMRCAKVLRVESPVFVVGTGGYAAGPLIWLAARRGVPVGLQEQNAWPGVATRMLARSARQIHLGFPEAERHLRLSSGTEVFSHGNPIVVPSPASTGEVRTRLGLPPDVPVVLITGGSQGSRAINTAVAQAVNDRLLEGVALLWATGAATYDMFAHLADSPMRQVTAFWDPIGDAYAACDLVVARAGAMTTAEITAWGRPAILIPLPLATADHQTQNALALEVAGAAVHIREPDLTPAVLADAVRSILDDRGRRAQMEAASRSRGRPQAAQSIAKELLRLVP